MEVERDRLDLSDEGRLSPPTLADPLYGCATVVVVTGFITHATLDVEVHHNGAVVQSVTAVPGGWPNPQGCVISVTELVEGQTVRARQHHDGHSSPWSGFSQVRNHRDDFPAGPPRPQISPLPVHDCGARTGVANLLIGSTVSVTADGAKVGEVAGAKAHQGVNVTPLYGTGQAVRARAGLCHDMSPPSEQYTTTPAALPLPAPGFEPVYESATQIVVTGLAPGARFSVEHNGQPLVTDNPTWGGTHSVGLPAPVAPGDGFSATQRLCENDPPSDPGKIDATVCTQLPAPVPGPIQDGDEVVVLFEFVPDGIIRVWKNNLMVGWGSGPEIPLSEPVFDTDTVYITQDLPGGCRSSKAWETTPLCVDPPYGADPASPDLFPVGWFEYDADPWFTGGDGTDVDPEIPIRALVMYPAEDDGEKQAFNVALRTTVEAPVVLIAHGNHRRADPSYLGYKYLQRHLARQGFVAISIDANGTNEYPNSAGNIEYRALLIVEHLKHLVALKSSGDGPLAGAFDLRRVGVMGHSRGGESVVRVSDSALVPTEVDIQGVLALAPTEGAATRFVGCTRDLLVVLPEADGDVRTLAGTKHYDRSGPDAFRAQVLMSGANHNFFNSTWLNDDYETVDSSGGPDRRSRQEQEQLLTSVTCAFFRTTLMGAGVGRQFLAGRFRANPHIERHVRRAFQFSRAEVVDDHEDGNPNGNRLGGANTYSGGDELSFEAGASSHSSLRGATSGLVLERGGEATFAFTERGLDKVEIWVRAARLSDDAATFEMGLRDDRENEVWVPVEQVGGLPTRWPHLLRTSVLCTYRFPAHCFSRTDPDFRLGAVTAIRLRNKSVAPIAFDDLHLVEP